nr:tail lysozyme [uncultured Mediterranean phage uvMED]
MSNNVPVGIMIPYVKGNDGYFQQTYSDVTRIYTNLKMLLMTSKGERPMMPTYGSKLRELLFSPNLESYVDEIFLESITECTEKWMPEITITEVNVERDSDDYPNKATLNIFFSINQIPDSYEELTLEVEA